MKFVNVLVSLCQQFDLVFCFLFLCPCLHSNGTSTPEKNEEQTTKKYLKLFERPKHEIKSLLRPAIKSYKLHGAFPVPSSYRSASIAIERWQLEWMKHFSDFSTKLTSWSYGIFFFLLPGQLPHQKTQTTSKYTQMLALTLAKWSFYRIVNVYKSNIRNSWKVLANMRPTKMSSNKMAEHKIACTLCSWLCVCVCVVCSKAQAFISFFCLTLDVIYTFHIIFFWHALTFWYCSLKPCVANDFFVAIRLKGFQWDARNSIGEPFFVGPSRKHVKNFSHFDFFFLFMKHDSITLFSLARYRP